MMGFVRVWRLAIGQRVDVDDDVNLCDAFRRACAILWGGAGSYDFMEAMVAFDACKRGNQCMLCKYGKIYCQEYSCSGRVPDATDYVADRHRINALLNELEASSSSHALWMRAYLLNKIFGDDLARLALLKEAAKAKHAGALVTLGAYYYIRNARAVAVTYFEQAKEVGCLAANYWLGWCHWHGEGVGQMNRGLARQLWLAAASSDVLSLMSLVDTNTDMEGIISTKATKVEMCTKAANKGNRDAMTWLGIDGDELWWLRSLQLHGRNSPISLLTRAASIVQREAALQTTARLYSLLFYYRVSLFCFQSLRTAPVLGDFYLLQHVVNAMIGLEETKVLRIAGNIVEYQCAEVVLEANSDVGLRLLLAACVRRNERQRRFESFCCAALLPYWITVEFLESLRYSIRDDIYQFGV